MLETLYKTDNPMAEVSECYEISVLPRKGEPVGFAFREDHGWWDESEKHFKHSVTIYNPDEATTLEEAGTLYRVHRLHLARNGFLHSFTPVIPGGGHEYELIDLDLLQSQ
jgi:hypothetical protein